MTAQLHPVLKRAFGETFDSGDAWGSAMGFGFSLCDFITDHGGDVPPELGYRQAMGGSETDAYEYQTLVELYALELFTIADLELFAKVLDRYLDILRAKGLDY